MSRIIGITHRRKKNVQGDARPTLVSIWDGNQTKTIKLEDETDELDFILGRLPISYREASPDEDLKGFRPHQLKSRKKKGEKEKTILVPDTYIGLKADDRVVMMLGGSGDRLAYAIVHQGVAVWRIPPFVLKNCRDKNADKNADCELLVSLFRGFPTHFQKMTDREMEQIRLIEAYRQWQDAMRDRIKCEQRLSSRLVGMIFVSPEGGYPEGSVRDEYERVAEGDAILCGMVREEKFRLGELTKLVEKSPVWTEILKDVEGIGPSITARIIALVGDVRRFPTAEKFLAYCGLHTVADTNDPLDNTKRQLARKRSGEVANWSNDIRQAFWLFGADQCTRRKESVWGKKQRAYKARLRAKHPEPEEVVNKAGKTVTRYSDGHILKMAQWRTASRFARWLYRKWMALEKTSITTNNETVDKYEAA